MENVINVKNKCHDCSKDITINADIIENGVLLKYDLSTQTGNKGEMIDIFKCSDCYAQNKALNNFQKCEVYSRVVGYIRPVQQWNNGKKQEFEERKEYLMPGGSCGC
jgi:ribonucleoside-triphosphate reductase